MSISNARYLEYIKAGNYRPIYRIDFLRKEDESVSFTAEGKIKNNSGNITIQKNEGVRRTCNFNLINTDNFFTSFVSNLTIGDKFQLWLGFEIDGEDKLFSQGIFCYDDPTLNSHLSDRSISISGTDKFSILNGTHGGTLETTYVFNSGGTYGNLIRSLLALNVVADVKIPLIDSSIENLVLPYTITKETGSKVSEILLEATYAISALTYYDEFGYLVVEPFVNNNQKGSIYDFDYDDYNYLESTKKILLSEIFNSILVIGENVQNTNVPIVVEVENNDLSDPNSIPNLGRKKLKVITQDTKGINTENLARIRGQWESQKISSKLSEISINCLSLPHLDVNEIVTLQDTYVDAIRERFLINSINLPIGTDIKATVSGVKAVN